MQRIYLLLFLFIVIVSIAWLSTTGTWKRTMALHAPRQEATKAVIPATTTRLKDKASAAKLYAAKNRFNTSLCFLVDMSIHSGHNRFFVYDLEKDSVVKSGLVTHGRCNVNWLEGRKYDNKVGCGCTSLGKYKVGYPYQGRFGLAYKLYGLDKTNDKAFERFVVLHSHSCVPATEVTNDICQSDGCPTVAPDFLQQLKPIIDASGRPVLLWIYE